MMSCALRRRPCARRKCASLAVLLGTLLLACVPLPARAADDPDVERTVRYRVEIDAPRALASLLESTLDLVRWQSYEELTAPVLEELIREGIDQTKEAAAAQGYFNAHVDVALEQPATPDGEYTLRLKVEPGPPALVASVEIFVDGPATEDAVFGEPAIAQLKREWSLPVGALFTQEQWDDAKARAVSTLAASPYAGATLARSEARVDPEANTVSIDISLTSGPAYHFGELEIEGLEKYNASVVRNFSTLVPGQPYTREALNEFTRRLLASRYFASVQSRIVTDPDHTEAATIRVSVIDAPRKRIEGGLSYATDNGLHADARYTDVNIDGRGLQFDVTGRIDKKIQGLGLEFRRPPTASLWIDSLTGAIERTYISSLETLTASIGVRRQTVEERRRTGFGATYYEDFQRPVGADGEHSRALMFEVDRTWRNVDSLVLPTHGYVLRIEGGYAPTGLATRTFGRLIAQAAAWQPLTSHNELAFRAEGGAVLANSRTGIPSALLFRTGGDTTVRGYAYQSLGVQEGDATVGGRYYAVASAEATHYFTDIIGAAVFVDAGNAGDSAHDLRPVWGYGTGLRVKSPVGRLRVDLAYGQETHKIRLHMSVGLSF
jgi:translocation and assembly module TamA